MKSSTKIIIGIGIATTASAAVAVILSEKAVKKFGHAKKRCLLKKFVHTKLDGNEKILDVVNEMSDEDVDVIVRFMDKVKDGRKKISVYGDTAKEATEKIKEAFLQFIGGTE